GGPTGLGGTNITACLDGGGVVPSGDAGGAPVECSGYATCVEQKCSTNGSGCFAADGACKDVATCDAACDPCDTACHRACVPAACTSCVTSCTPPGHTPDGRP